MDVEWAKVLANARILQVIACNDTRAAVVAELPQALLSKKIVAPIDVRFVSGKTAAGSTPATIGSRPRRGPSRGSWSRFPKPKQPPLGRVGTPGVRASRAWRSPRTCVAKRWM